MSGIQGTILGPEGPETASATMKRFFDVLARAVNLDADTQERAWNIMQILEKTYRVYSQDPGEVKKSWALCTAVAIFTASATATTWNGVWVTQILKSCEVSGSAFFMMIEEGKHVLGLSPVILDGVHRAKAQFDSAVLLFKSFEKVPFDSPQLKTFAWTVFTFARVELCAASDFVNDINILIAWLIILRYNVSLLDESATTAFSGSAVDNTSFIETMGLRGKVNPAEVEATLKDLLKPWLTALSTSGDLRGTITLSADLGEGPLGSGLSFVSPANLAHNSSHIYAMYQSKRLRTVASVDERFLLGSEAAFINTPSKFASFGSRRLSALASRRLFTSDVEEFGGEPSETEHATALATAQALPPVPQSPERPPSLPHTFVPSTAVVASPFRAPSRNSGFRPPPSTPLPFQTPVSATVECIRWLNDNFGSASDSMPEELEVICSRCDPNPRVLILSLVVKMGTAISAALDPSAIAGAHGSPEATASPRGRLGVRLPVEGTSSEPPAAFRDACGQESSERTSKAPTVGEESPGLPSPLDRTASVLEESPAVVPKRPSALQLGVRMYYKVLLDVARRDQERLQRADVPVLRTELFHKSLFGCCMEIVAYALSRTNILFPKMADLVGVSAYEFSKGIEFARKPAPHTPQTVAVHLMCVEDMILEEHAWNLLLVRNAHQGGPAVPSSGIPDAAPHASISKATAQFLQKTAKLAATRIEFLCDKLELSESTANEVWTTIRHILEVNLALLKDQHLDRIIMCTIYGVCKVNALDKKFSQIIDKYKELRTDGRVSSVIHNITMRDVTNVTSSSPVLITGDIIAMYNKFFLPSLKEYLLRFKKSVDTSGTMQPIAVKILPRVAKPVTTPASVRVADNLYVTSRRQVTETPSSVHLTPGTRAMYAFGEPVSQEALAMINRAINKRQSAGSEPASLLPPSAAVPAPEVTQHSTGEGGGDATSMGLLIAAAMGELTSQSNLVPEDADEPSKKRKR